MPIENVGPGNVSNNYGVRSSSDPSLLSSNYTVKALDNNRIYYCTTALTVTVPAGLSPRPSVIFLPPPSGNLSIAVSGATTLNGAATTLTRTRAANPSGVVLFAYLDAEGYGVSGA